MRPSNAQLEWGKCGYNWDDPTLFPFWKRLKTGIYNLLSMNSEVLNNLSKIMNGEPCPNWGICIIKLKGCNHMVCTKWNHEFWWLWLGKYPSYRHTEQTFCPIRKVMLNIFILMFLFVTINNKLWFSSSNYNYFEQIIVEWTVFFTLANCYAASAFIEIEIIHVCIENRDLSIAFPDYSEIYNSNYKKLLIIAIIYPFLWLEGTYLGYTISHYFRRMILLLEIEAIFLFIVWIIIGAIILIYKVLVRTPPAQEIEISGFFSNSEESNCLVLFSFRWIHAIISKSCKWKLTWWFLRFWVPYILSLYNEWKIK